MAFKLGSAFVQVRADFSRLAGDVRTANRILMTGIGLKGAGLISAGLSAAVSAAYNLASAMGTVAEAAANVNDEIDRMRVALGVVLKNQARADQLVGQMRKFAAETPFATDTLMQSFQLLRNYGIQTKKILPMLKAIGDAGAASPRGMETTVHRIALAIGQMKTQGKLLGGEMKQLAEAGVPAMEILKKHFKMSFQELQKAVKSGAVNMDDVIDALISGIDERFGGTMEKMAHTWSGLTERINDKTKIALQQMTEPLFRVALQGREAIAMMFDSPEFERFVRTVRALAQDMADGFAPVRAVLVRAFKEALPVVREIAANLREMAGVAMPKLAMLGKVFALGLGAALNEAQAWLEFFALLSASAKITGTIISYSIAKVAVELKARFDHIWDTMKTAVTNVAIFIVNVFTAAFKEVAEIASMTFGVLFDQLKDSFETFKRVMIKLEAGDFVGMWQDWDAFKIRTANRAKEGDRAMGERHKGFLARMMAGAMNGIRPMPKYKAPDTSMFDRAIAALFKQLHNLRNSKNVGRSLKGLFGSFGEMAGALPGQAGAAAAGIGGNVAAGAFGLARGIARFVNGPDAPKKGKGGIVGIAELSQRIQEGIINSEEKKDRKAMVKGINAVDAGVKAVKGAVDKAVGAFTDAAKWIGKVTP